MTCDTTRAAIAVTGDGDWPAAALLHLAGCEACAAVVVEQTLTQPPPIAIPTTFAVDVARRARLEPEVSLPRSTGVAIGLAAAAALLVGSLAWFAAGATSTVLPSALLLLACGEAIVLAVWAFIGANSGDDTHCA